MTKETTKRQRILSGVQPSGTLHWGNYFGALRQHIQLQDQGEAFYFIANYHALTSINDAGRLRSLTHEVAVTYLALGLDPKRATLFRQSDVPEVTELTWLLSTVVGMGLLERAHAYKDKVSKGVSPRAGLFFYPVLMAADILIYDSTLVPVGEDQRQHIEMTRQIAGSFNEIYGNVFVIPEPRIEKASGIVPGIDGAKMSKSYNNTIDLFAPAAELKKRVMAIVTDSAAVDEKKSPEGNSIYELYKLFSTKEETDDLAARFRAGGMGYGDAKKALLAKAEPFFAGFRERYEELQHDKKFIDDVLDDGAKRARSVARTVVDRARKACGID